MQVIALKKVLITGVMGFIGFHLCQRLLNDCIEVIGIDSMEGIYDQKIFEEKWMFIGRNANFHFYEESLEQLPLKKLLNDVDVVYHLASTRDEGHELETVKQKNEEIAKKLVESCRENSRLIFPSTIEVYGKQTGEITEKTPTNPISSYGIAKLAEESVILREKANVIILRLPTVYGPWQPQNMALHRLLFANITGTEANISDENSTIDLLHVDDVVESLFLAGICSYENEIFNISSGKSRQWHQAKAFIFGKKDCPAKDHHWPKVYVSGKKAKKLLKFEPKISIEEGVKKQKEHMLKYIGLYKTSPC